MLSRWKVFAQGLILLSLIRLLEWSPALYEGIGSETSLVPLWQEFNSWFEPSSWWLKNWFANGIIGLYVVLLVWQFLKPSIFGLLVIGAIQFQLHLVLYFFVTMADSWRLICLWYAILGMFFAFEANKPWVKWTFVGHLAIFYWVSLWHKLMYVEWQNGTALQLAAWHPFWGESFPEIWSGKFFTYGAIVLEFLFPFSWIFSKTRFIGVISAVLFHTLLMIFIPVVGFSLVMIWSNLMVLNQSEWDKIKKALPKLRLFLKIVKY